MWIKRQKEVMPNGIEAELELLYWLVDAPLWMYNNATERNELRIRYNKLKKYLRQQEKD